MAKEESEEPREEAQDAWDTSAPVMVVFGTVKSLKEKGVHMKIRIHYRDQHSGSWAIAIRDVEQIPQAGEYIAPAPIKVYRVILTLHVFFDADYTAEVFAELVDFEEVQCETLGEQVWHG